MFGQVSHSVSYTRRSNILEILLKDPCKDKTLLKEKRKNLLLLQESDDNLFGEINPFAHNKDFNDWGNRLWKSLRVPMTKILLFEKTPCLTRINCNMVGDIITRQNQTVETKTVKIANFVISARKFHQGGLKSHSKYEYLFHNSNGGSFHH